MKLCWMIVEADLAKASHNAQLGDEILEREMIY